MDKRSILQSIIDHGGQCRFMYEDGKYLAGVTLACHICPMNKLSQRADGTYRSCYDSLVTDPKKEADPIYYYKAVELLSDILMDDILRGIPIAENT